MQHPLGVLDTVALNLYTSIAAYMMCTFWTCQPLLSLRKAVDHLTIHKQQVLKTAIVLLLLLQKRYLGKLLY